MKRFIFALCLLLICIGLCVASNIIVEDYVKDLSTILDSTRESILKADYAAASDIIKKADEKWETAEILFGSLSESLLIENMDLYFNSLTVYISAEETGMALVVIDECKTTLEEILLWQKITLKNIF